MFADFHIHSTYSDGELIPSEIVNRCKKIGFDAIGITEHVDQTNYEVIKDIKEIKKIFDEINVFVGAEITHVPPEKINSLVENLKSLNTDIIIVHGETIVEPVQKGTNKVAVENEDVDILAHPGLINENHVKKAKENNVFLEITSRRGHCLTNGHVANMALKTGADLLVNTDTHSPDDLITKEQAIRIAKGAGLTRNEVKKVVEENPKKLVEGISKK